MKKLAVILMLAIMGLVFGCNGGCTKTQPTEIQSTEQTSEVRNKNSGIGEEYKGDPGSTPRVFDSQVKAKSKPKEKKLTKEELELEERVRFLVNTANEMSERMKED